MENQLGQDVDEQEQAKRDKTENENTKSTHDTALSDDTQNRDNVSKCGTSFPPDSNDNASDNDSLQSGKPEQNQQRTEKYLKSENEQMDIKSNGTDKTLDITESILPRPAMDGNVRSSPQHSGHPADADATSDFGDEYEISDEQSDENEPFIATIYTCQSCGWKPHMEKCIVHRPFQTGFSNGVYQYQGIMPSQVHSYQNYNYSGYAAGQRPVYQPCVQPRPTVDMRFNPATSQVVAVPSVVVNQTENLNDYIKTIQSLRRRAFCLSIIMIVLVFGVLTLAILMS
ncbi:uncharacterized protein LOC134684594 [Mytilus trossulus]|uniref:uncharacterized protein LOC134684594 n=1 Tax=Mytilus trossulus TaxID=6551 RepID=UPI003007C563